MNLLEVKSIKVFYGKMRALDGVSFGVEEGNITAVIGHNGGGKSTILKAISGLVQVRCGNITFKGREISNLPPYKLVREGISFAPEGGELFPYLSVHDNLKMGGFNNRAWSKVKENLKMVYELFPPLLMAENRPARTLSGGERQMLIIGRALMSEPELLMCDEVSAGLAPNLTLRLFKTLEDIKEKGITVLAVEQNASKILAIASKAYVVENGRVVMEGTGKELLSNPHVKEAYLRV